VKFAYGCAICVSFALAAAVSSGRHRRLPMWWAELPSQVVGEAASPSRGDPSPLGGTWWKPAVVMS